MRTGNGARSTKQRCVDFSWMPKPGHRNHRNGSLLVSDTFLLLLLEFWSTSDFWGFLVPFSLFDVLAESAAMFSVISDALVSMSNGRTYSTRISAWVFLG